MAIATYYPPVSFHFRVEFQDIPGIKTQDAFFQEVTGLSRELVSQRLTVMKAMGVIETRINEKNVLHWFVSTRGKALLADILSGQEQKKSA